MNFIVVGLIAALSGGALHQTAFLRFMIAPVEGIFSANSALAAASGISAVMTALIVALLSKPDALSSPEAAGFIPLLPIVLIALIISTGFFHLRTLRLSTQQVLIENCDSLAVTMGCLALRCGLSGRVSAVSPNCESLFGLAPRELMNRGFFDRVQVADRPTFLKAISDASVSSETAAVTVRWRGSERIAHKNYAGPVYHWLEMRARRSEEDPAARQEHHDSDVVVFFRDVTEAKCRDAELKNARADLEDANIARAQFFAHAGHEIRAPLNAIAGFSQLLADPERGPAAEPERQREYARIIHQSGQHLLAVIDSIMDMSLIQSGRLAIILERFAAAPQIDLCCDMVGLQARNSEVVLLRAYPANLDTILCDKRLFTQILTNLLSNAVKFTPANGRVTIIARAEANSFFIKVTDTGIGIDAEDLSRLGDPFFQAKGSSELQNKGTGLGLSIVRGFVGLLGGEIMVASEPEKGTCVRVRLPLESHALKGSAKGPVTIATRARLPQPEEPLANQQMMVKKIA